MKMVFRVHKEALPNMRPQIIIGATRESTGAAAAARVARLAERAIADAVPDLAEQALRNGGARSDNVTVLAVEWEGAEEAASPPAVLTRSLGDEVFASTIQARLAGSDVAADELDEAEIDRSIREINEAIKRSSLKKP